VKRFAALLTLLIAHAAAADPSPEDVKRARQHLEAGERLVKQQKFDQAISELQAAYGLDPQPIHIYNLGVAHHLRGDDAIAIEYYRLFLVDGFAAKEARDANRFLVSLEKKVAEARAAKVKQDLAAAQAQATQQGSSQATAEMLIYAQYVADAESKERKVALMDEEIKTIEADITAAKQRTVKEREEAREAMTEAQRWERHARLAPSGGGRARRVMGAVLLMTGAAALTYGAHDILSREASVDVPEYGSIFLGAGTGALLGGFVLAVWGATAANEPRAAGSFTLAPTIGREASSLSLTAAF
jgi:hypothetical protein